MLPKLLKLDHLHYDVCTKMRLERVLVLLYQICSQEEAYGQYPNYNTVKSPIKDTLKEDKPPNKGQAESTHVYTLYRKSPLKEDNVSTKDKTAGPKGVLITRFHCTFVSSGIMNLVFIHSIFNPAVFYM